MDEGIWQRHENKIRDACLYLELFLLLAMIATFVPLFGVFKPAGETLGVWWQRGGAPTVVFALLAQNRAHYLGLLLTPGSFTSKEMESLRLKYRARHRIGDGFALGLTVLGTVVWGYGDLLLNWFMGSF